MKADDCSDKKRSGVYKSGECVWKAGPVRRYPEKGEYGNRSGGIKGPPD
jgi:hypothetical protein